MVYRNFHILFVCLVLDDFDKFWEVNSEIIGKDVLKYVPCRIYIKDLAVIQEPFCVDSSQNEIPLSTYLQAVLPPSVKETMSSHTFRVMLHGISIPLNTCILFLALNFSYCDNFLHLVVFT